MAHYQTGICQNCSTTLSRELLLAGKNFCGEKCTQTASLVRYCRNKIKEGTFHNPDIQEAIKYKLGFVLSGGYHKNARRVSPAMRSFIFTRDNHTCVLCGEPATDIDHISGDDNIPENLRACFGKKTAAHTVPLPVWPFEQPGVGRPELSCGYGSH